MTYQLGGQKHVFVDWDFVEPGYGLAGMGTDVAGSYEMPYGVKLAVHPPNIDSQPIIEPDRPWEPGHNWHTTIFEDDGRFRLYYRIWDVTGGQAGHAKSGRLAYAESEDGKTWVKPNVGTHDFNGSTENNVLELGRPARSPKVFKDPSAGPDERYKLVFREQVSGVNRVLGATSPDGLRWHVLDEPLMDGYHADTHNQIMYDEAKGKYIGYWRGWHPTGSTIGRRTIAYAETEDFTTWPVPQTIVWPDIDDGPTTDIYTNSYAPWPGAAAHLMFPSMYVRDVDVTELHLMTSRDGLRWERISRDPIVPVGPPGSGLDAGIYAGSGLVSIRPGEWSLPVSPQAITHNQQLIPEALRDRRHNGIICMASWRDDGWTSIEAESEGRFATSRFVFEGGSLVLNSWSNYGGEIRVELVEAPEEPRRVEFPPEPGRSFDDCDVITGDNLRHTVTWNGDPDLSAWAGKPVRLRFKLLRSRLHAMQVR